MSCSRSTSRATLLVCLCAVEDSTVPRRFPPSRKTQILVPLSLLHYIKFVLFLHPSPTHRGPFCTPQPNPLHLRPQCASFPNSTLPPSQDADDLLACRSTTVERIKEIELEMVRTLHSYTTSLSYAFPSRDPQLPQAGSNCYFAFRVVCGATTMASETWNSTKSLYRLLWSLLRCPARCQSSRSSNSTPPSSALSLFNVPSRRA